MKSLAKSEQGLDDQVAVLTRIFFVEINKLREAAGEGPLEADVVNPMFLAWSKFRARPDAKDHMQRWVFGKSLDDLPPLPEPTEEPAKQGFLDDDINKLQEAMDDSPEFAESELPDERTIFGGDYGKNDLGNEEVGQGEPKHEASGTDNEMPVLSAQDTPVSEDEDDNSEVPELSA